MKHADLVEVFGVDGVERWPLVPEDVTHPTSRRFITEVGVPSLEAPGASVTTSTENGGARLPAYRDRWDFDWPWSRTGAFDDWLLVAYCSWDGRAFLDGVTGTVHFVPDYDEPPRLMNSTIEDFTYFLYAFQRDRGRYEDDYVRVLAQLVSAEDDEAAGLARRLLEHPSPAKSPDVEFVRRALAYPSMASDDDREAVLELLARTVAAKDLAIELHDVDPAPFVGDVGDVFSRDPELDLPSDFAGPWTHIFQSVREGTMA
ncbi:SUKH-4 family immunity protein [Actinomadura atramentaria]|uniref:SUKH-4 family immunity protein n=1 Tax=Actinomadura atramentaria TaxID=1990 RepID=UPI000366D40C|nr:SUKH-4 family immunity protein [Actinomadura atramentaria]